MIKEIMKQRSNMKKPLCSVVMPVYNAENFIDMALQSVLNQTIKDIEIICVNDCSTDKSIEKIKHYQEQDDRIVLLQNNKNMKVSQTRNKGIGVAKSDWIALIDSDDCWESNFLEKVIQRQKETGGLFISTGCKFMNNDGKNLDSVFLAPKEITYKQLLKQNKILCSTVFAKKELLQKHPFYADDAHEDYVCWLNILKEIKKSYTVDEPLMIYRLTKGSKSRNKFKAILMTYKTYKIHGIKFFGRLYYMFCNALNGIKKYSKIK